MVPLDSAAGFGKQVRAAPLRGRVISCVTEALRVRADSLEHTHAANAAASL